MWKAFCCDKEMTGIGQLYISEEKNSNKFHMGNVQNYGPNNKKIYYPTIDKKNCFHSFHK